jgi:hypothetical protein
MNNFLKKLSQSLAKLFLFVFIKDKETKKSHARYLILLIIFYFQLYGIVVSSSVNDSFKNGIFRFFHKLALYFRVLPLIAELNIENFGLFILVALIISDIC